MTTHRTDPSVTRRAALAGLGAGGLGLALATTARQVSAQDATAEAMANHPLVGLWQLPIIGPIVGPGELAGTLESAAEVKEHGLAPHTSSNISSFRRSSVSS